MPLIKKKAKEAAKIAAPKSLPARLAIDYPAEGETVNPGHYAVRISVEDDTEIEISIDGGPWQPCREAAGYRWFDWAPSIPGIHVISARPRKAGPRAKTAARRTCSVRNSALN